MASLKTFCQILIGVLGINVIHLRVLNDHIGISKIVLDIHDVIDDNVNVYFKNFDVY